MTKQKRADECLRDWLTTSDFNQSDVAEILEVSRQAVSKWVNYTLTPSERHARELDELSGGAVPATLWQRRRMPQPKSKGAEVIQMATTLHDGSIAALAAATGLPQRSLSRWSASTNAPRRSQLAVLNKALKANLTPDDFTVSA